MRSGESDRALPRPRFRIQKSPDQRSFASFPELIAGYHVFRRLSMPRHPPCTLSSLTTITDHRPTSLGKTPDVRTAGNGSDHDEIASAALWGATAIVPSRQKGARRLPAKTEKTLSPPPGRNRTLENQMPGVADLAKPHRRGGYRDTRPPKPSVEPLFTCQRTSD